MHACMHASMHAYTYIHTFALQKLSFRGAVRQNVFIGKNILEITSLKNLEKCVTSPFFFVVPAQLFIDVKDS